MAMMLGAKAAITLLAIAANLERGREFHHPVDKVGHPCRTITATDWRRCKLFES